MNTAGIPLPLRQEVVIANATADSNAVEIQSQPTQLAIQTPSVWTAANIGLSVSPDGTSWFDVCKEDGSRIVISGVQTASPRIYVFPESTWLVSSYRYMRVESLNTGTGASEPQGAERKLYLIFRYF